jgi:hypothetical protein
LEQRVVFSPPAAAEYSLPSVVVSDMNRAFVVTCNGLVFLVAMIQLRGIISIVVMFIALFAAAVCNGIIAVSVVVIVTTRVLLLIVFRSSDFG